MPERRAPVLRSADSPAQLGGQQAAALRRPPPVPATARAPSSIGHPRCIHCLCGRVRARHLNVSARIGIPGSDPARLAAVSEGGALFHRELRRRARCLVSGGRAAPGGTPGHQVWYARLGSGGHHPPHLLSQPFPPLLRLPITSQRISMSRARLYPAARAVAAGKLRSSMRTLHAMPPAIILTATTCCAQPPPQLPLQLAVRQKSFVVKAAPPAVQAASLHPTRPRTAREPPRTIPPQTASLLQRPMTTPLPTVSLPRVPLPATKHTQTSLLQTRRQRAPPRLPPTHRRRPRMSLQPRHRLSRPHSPRPMNRLPRLRLSLRLSLLPSTRLIPPLSRRLSLLRSRLLKPQPYPLHNNHLSAQASLPARPPRRRRLHHLKTQAPTAALLPPRTPRALTAFTRLQVQTAMGHWSPSQAPPSSSSPQRVTPAICHPVMVEEARMGA